MKRKKVLYLGDYVARTGFGTVSKNIIRELRKHYGENLQLDIVAINYFGEPYYEDENTFVVSGRKQDVQDDPYARYFFLKMLQDSNEYDGIFICQDLGAIVPFIEVLEHIKKEKRENNKKSFKSIFYFPIDCHIVPILLRKLEFFDVLVTYTDFAKKEIQKFRPELKVKVIPHGNNSKEFYPLDEKTIKEFREDFFGDNKDKFIITCVNRNQPRKDIPNTIFGFIEARKIWYNNLPEPFLYLQMHPNDPMGWDIRGIMLQTNLVEDKDYKLLPKQYEDEGMPVDMLNKLYNASDVSLSTTLGEGWGLGFSESAACKVPIIAPYTTSFMEMSNYGKNAYMLEIINPICNHVDNIIREQTDIYEVADTILQVAKDKYLDSDGLSKQKLMVENSYKWVKKLEWADICKQWIEYFKIF
jgi:glycosyltransferase involved in cell wall biosynthesis